MLKDNYPVVKLDKIGNRFDFDSVFKRIENFLGDKFGYEPNPEKPENYEHY